MDRFQPIKFEKLSEAFAYLEGGGELFIRGIESFELASPSIIAGECYKLYTKAKPSPWYEKLGGAVENGVLCFETRAGGHYIACEYDASDDSILCSDGRWRRVEVLEPLTRAEIQRFMDNAPEE